MCTYTNVLLLSCQRQFVNSPAPNRQTLTDATSVTNILAALRFVSLDVALSAGWVVQIAAVSNAFHTNIRNSINAR